MRAVGVLLLSGSGLALGLAGVEELAVRRRDLGDLVMALSLMEAELSLCLPDTPALLAQLARRVPGRTGDFFHLCVDGLEGLGEQDFPQIWAEALAGSGLSLPEVSRRQLLALGEALGRYDADQLLRCCRQTREALETEARQAAERLRSQGRVCSTLGLSLGLFAAMVLL